MAAPSVRLSAPLSGLATNFHGLGVLDNPLSYHASRGSRGPCPRKNPLNEAGGSGSRSGLLMDSVIMADNLATVRDNEIDRVIGTLPNLAEVDAALRMALAL